MEKPFPVISESSSFLLTSFDLKEDCGEKGEKKNGVCYIMLLETDMASVGVS